MQSAWGRDFKGSIRKTKERGLHGLRYRISLKRRKQTGNVIALDRFILVGLSGKKEEC